MKLQNRFLNFFPQIANYEEEGKKYKPAIFFTNNIDMVVKNIPNATKIVLFTDANENMFASRLKSLVPFCNLYWCVYVSISDDKIEYEGRLWSLSAFTAEFLPESMQYTSGSYQGPKYFSYEGKTMWQMRLDGEEDE